jgi:hypothetical protein
MVEIDDRVSHVASLELTSIAGDTRRGLTAAQ